MHSGPGGVRGTWGRRLAAAVLSVVAAASCGADDGDGETRGGTPPDDDASFVLVDGLGPALAGLDGDRLFVWGGLPVSDPSSANSAEGVVVSLPSGERAEVPEAPFATPVANPRAAAHGDRALVVGQACAEWVDADEGRRCRPGDLVGAVFDAGTDEWTPLVGDAIATAFDTAVSTDVSSAGVALISSAARPASLVLVDLGSAVATVLPPPPLAGGGGEEPTSTAACVTATDVLVAERTAPPGFEAGADQPPPARVHALSLGGGAWRTLAGPPGIWDPVMTCADGGALLSNGVGVHFGAVWLRTADASWHTVDAPAGSPAPYSVRSRRGDDVLLFDGTAAGHGLAYRSADGAFAAVTGEPTPFDCDRGQCIAASGDYVGGAGRAARSPRATNVFWFEP